MEKFRRFVNDWEPSSHHDTAAEALANVSREKTLREARLTRRQAQVLKQAILGTESLNSTDRTHLERLRIKANQNRRAPERTREKARIPAGASPRE